MTEYEYKELDSDGPLTVSHATLLMIHFENRDNAKRAFSLKDGAEAKINIEAYQDQNRAIPIEDGVTFEAGIAVTGLGADQKVSLGAFYELRPAVAKPTVASCGPAEGKPGENLLLTITGTNFREGATVSFDGSGIKVLWKKAKFRSATSLEVKIKIEPSAGANKHKVTVTNPDGTNGEKANCFEVKP